MTKNKTPIILVFALLVGLAVLLLVSSRGQDASKTGTDGQPTDSADKADITIALNTTKKAYSYDEPVQFSSEISNNTATAKTYTFNSTCTQGTLFIDDKPTQAAQLCGDAITDVVVQPGEPTRHSYDFKLVREFSSTARQSADGDYIELEGELLLQPGDHTAYVKWQDVTSPTLSFSVAMR